VNGEAIMLRDDAQRRGLEVLKTIAVPCALAAGPDQPAELKPVLEALHQNLAEGGLESVIVLDGDGKVIAKSDPAAVPPDWPRSRQRRPIRPSPSSRRCGTGKRRRSCCRCRSTAACAWAPATARSTSATSTSASRR
jgi:hypothetical protein